MCRSASYHVHSLLPEAKIFVFGGEEEVSYRQPAFAFDQHSFIAELAKEASVPFTFRENGNTLRGFLNGAQLDIVKVDNGGFFDRLKNLWKYGLSYSRLEGISPIYLSSPTR